MALKKNFLRSEIQKIKISRNRIIIGIILATISIILIYSMLYLFREMFRLMSITDDYDMWTLSDKEVKFYNLFYAFLAVIFSQSFFINFIFNIPKRPFYKKNWRKITILNDQRVLNVSFINWFAKLAFIFALMFGFGYTKGYYSFSFYPTYKYLFILIIIVLFLQSFNSLRFVYPRKSLKWFIFSVLIVSILSIAISNLNIINYRKINELVQSKCVFDKYKLILPETNVYKSVRRLSLVNNIYIVESKQENELQNPLIVIDSKEVPFSELKQSITHIREIYDKRERPLIIYMLHIHEDIRMEYIYRLKNELYKSHIYTVSYSVTPENSLYDKRYYRGLSFSDRLFPMKEGWIYKLNDLKQTLKSCENVIEIEMDSLGNIFVNENLTEFKYFKNTLKKLVVKNNDYIFKIYVHELNTFLSYFQVRSTCREAIQELRNEFALDHYSCEYDNLNWDESDSIKDIFPELVLELNEKTKLMIDIK